MPLPLLSAPDPAESRRGSSAPPPPPPRCGFAVLTATLALLAAGCAERPPGATYDAGPLFYSESSEFGHTFVVTNTTDRQVRIVEQLCTCTCTSSGVANSTLKPGESTTLTMKVNLADVYRTWEIECSLITDHPKYPRWPYRITFRTYSRARFDSDLVDLGPIDTLSSGTATSSTERSLWLEIYSPCTGSADRLADFEITGGTAEISARGEPCICRLEAGRIWQVRYPITIRVPPSSDFTDGTRTLPIVARTHQGGRASTTVAWRQVSPMHIVPSELYFGIIGPSSSEVKTITLRTEDSKPFQLLRVSSDSTLVRVRLSDPSLEGQGSMVHSLDVELTIDGEAERRAIAGEVVILTDHPACPQVHIPWSGFIR
jgi:hypothetical protein